MQQIVDVHFPKIKQRLVEEALRIFFEVREVPGLKKKPSTSELLDWLKLLLNEEMTPETLRERDPRKLIPPLHGALLKNEQDVHLFERLAFLSPARGLKQTAPDAFLDIDRRANARRFCFPHSVHTRLATRRTQPRGKRRPGSPMSAGLQPQAERARP